MNKIESLQLLQTMIDFFESGNQQTDAVAKAILESDVEYKTIWTAKIKIFTEGTEWTGIRSPEAEYVAAALHSIQQILNDTPH